MTGKRVCLTIQEKLWIIKQRDDNENIKQTKIALDFQANLTDPLPAGIPGNVQMVE